MTSNFSSLGSFVFDKKTEMIYGYLEWVIMADFPFTFVENNLTRKFPKLGVLSRQKLELSLKWIPATSNIAEQLFSSARHSFSDNRKKMTPVNLEAILFLKANKKLWDAQVVKQATEKISENQQ